LLTTGMPAIYANSVF